MFDFLMMISQYKQKHGQRSQDTNTAYPINLILHISAEKVVFYTYCAFQEWVSSLMKCSQDGAWQILDWKKVHELFSHWAQTDTDNWLTDETQRQMRRAARQRPQTGTHPLVFCPPSTSALQPHPYNPTPLHLSLSICLWICHYSNLTPGAEEEGAAFLQTNKHCRAHLWWFV